MMKNCCDIDLQRERTALELNLGTGSFQQQTVRLWPWTGATRAEPLTLNTVQVSNEDQTQEVRLGPGTPVVTLIKAQH